MRLITQNGQSADGIRNFSKKSKFKDFKPFFRLLKIVRWLPLVFYSAWNIKMVEWKQTVKGHFSNSMSRTPRGHMTSDKKIKLIYFFWTFIWAKKIFKKRSRLQVTSFCKKNWKYFFSPAGCARELKLQPFDSESKSTSYCFNSLFSKKNHP